MSHILSIHDYRFLEKLSYSEYDVLLVAIDNTKIPENIANLNGIKQIVVPRPLPRLNFKYYLSLSAINLAVRHIIYRIVAKNKFLEKLFDDKTILLHEEFRYFFYVNKVLKIIKKFRPDLIHTGWVQLDGIVAVLTGYKPILLMPWGSDILIFPFEHKKKMDQAKYVINQSSHIYADCNDVKNTILQITEYDPNEISVFPNGIDLSLFNPERKKKNILNKLGWSKQKIIIMTRSFERIYGIQYFLMALPKIIKNEALARVLMIGSGPEEDVIKGIVDALDLNHYVHFTGFIPNDELAYYLNSAEIYVSTSITDGSSLSLLEAMACRLPVVVSDVPANCEWVKDGENGYIVPCKKVNPISDRVKTLLNDKLTSDRMGKLNLIIARERADWRKNYLLLERIYQGINEAN